MKHLNLLFLCLIISFAAVAQRTNNDPKGYYKNFYNEMRKINKKDLLYLEGSLKGGDPRRVNKYRELVASQLNDTKVTIERVGPYADSDLLQKEFIEGLDYMLIAFNGNFACADSMRVGMTRNLDTLNYYYDTLQAAEDYYYEGLYKIEAAMDYFSKLHELNFKEDIETAKRITSFDEANDYSKDMRKAFYVPYINMLNLVKAVENDNLDTVETIVDETARAIRTSLLIIEDYEGFEGDDFLYKNVKRTLEDFSEEVETTLYPLTEILSNRFIEEDEYDDAKKDLEKFSKNLERFGENFEMDHEDMLIEYLPAKK